MQMTKKDQFDRDGYVAFENLVSSGELKLLREIYDDFLSGKYDLKGLRSDLSGNSPDSGKIEKTTQIMRPSLVEGQLAETATYQTTLQEARDLLGNDVSLDFDMMINKAPNTVTGTPWHQDAAYWPDLPDKRAVSFWIALDDADAENGCMMYVAESHKMPLQPHEQPVTGGALQCSIGGDSNIVLGILTAGSAIAHHGYTLHAAFGNKTDDRHRRALILNFRPKSMIDLMRSQGYDHLGRRENKNKAEA